MPLTASLLWVTSKDENNEQFITNSNVSRLSSNFKGELNYLAQREALGGVFARAPDRGSIACSLFRLAKPVTAFHLPVSYKSRYIIIALFRGYPTHLFFVIIGPEGAEMSCILCDGWSIPVHLRTYKKNVRFQFPNLENLYSPILVFGFGRGCGAKRRRRWLQRVGGRDKAKPRRALRCPIRTRRGAWLFGRAAACSKGDSPDLRSHVAH